jgi:hypothetical protein
MELTGWFVIVALAVASLLTGLVSSAITPWGLLRHYWIVAKLVMTVPATILLLVHMQPITHVARLAGVTTLSRTDLHELRVQIVAEAVAALLVLALATMLSVYKPRGMTQYGWRKLHEQRTVYAEAPYDRLS